MAEDDTNGKANGHTRVPGCWDCEIDFPDAGNIENGTCREARRGPSWSAPSRRW